MAATPLVFITGASSGIGQALAARYAQAGWRLALVQAFAADQALAALAVQNSAPALARAVDGEALEAAVAVARVAPGDREPTCPPARRRRADGGVAPHDVHRGPRRDAVAADRSHPNDFAQYMLLSAYSWGTP